MKKVVILFLSFLSLSARQYDVLISGTLDYCDGLGKIPYGLIDCFGNDLTFAHAQESIATFYYDPSNVREKVARIAENDTADLFFYTYPIVTILSNDDYKKVPDNTLKIAYSMFEASQLPEAAVDCLNREFDMIVIPDPFLFKVYKNSGITRPIYCIPTGLYLEKYLAQPMKVKHEGPFVFGCVATDVSRKNLRKLVDAFAQEYGNNQAYQLQLHVKYEYHAGQSLQDYIEQLQVSNIEITSDTFGEEEYCDFLKSLDCYVLLSTGEGFSNTPREAMALGIPCIVSNNTGHTTLCQSGYVESVECTLVVDAWYDALKAYSGKQFDCTIEAARTALRAVAENYDQALKRAAQGREWVKRYVWKAFEQEYVTLFNPAAVEYASQDYFDVITQTIYTCDQRLYEKLQARIERKKPNITLAAPGGFCDGIGRIGYGLIDTLSDLCSFYSYQFQKEYDGYKNYIDFDDPYQVKKRMQFTDNINQNHLFFYINSINGYLQDPCYKNVSNKAIRIAYSMFESSAIPERAAEKLNAFFDMVIVPDPYHIKVYQDSGVTIPMFCIPTGLYLEKFLAEPQKEQTHKPFVFGCIATNSKRKNLKKIIQSFYELYGNNPDYLLKIHTKRSTMNEVSLEIIEEGVGKLFEKVDEQGTFSLADFFKNLPDPEETPEEMIKRLDLHTIDLTTDIMTEAEYIDYFKTIDCYLSLSTGEGFSNTPREALALGIPCIVSNNTAQRTICDSGTVIKVVSDQEIDAWYEGFSEPVGKHYDCSLQAVKQAMQQVVDDYQTSLKQAQQGRNWVKQYLWPALKEQYMTLLSPCNIEYGEQNSINSATRTITTNSRLLYEKYNNYVAR